MPDDTLDRLADLFRMLADKSRLRIVLALAQSGEMHVKALKELLATSQPAVSHHLHQMLDAGLVTLDRRGKHNFYSLATDRMQELLDQVFGTARQLRFRDWILSFQKQDAT